MSRLPALDFLRGFVAVGRRMSISWAADDLCLTQSAVSRQIQGLEEALGLKLFVRKHRAIAFTPEGERLFRSADGALQQLQDAIGALQDAQRQRPVTITASIGFVGLWLLPRLGSFQVAHPDIEVRLSANNTVTDLRLEGLDIAIRYAPDSALPPGAQRLFGETIAPVAHPALTPDRRISAELITHSTLLTYDGDLRPWWSWDLWLESQGWQGVRPKSILRFNQYDQMIHAAEAGQGIALGRLEVMDQMLADGRLLALTTPNPGPASPQAYCLLQAEAAPRREVQEVANWLLAQARLTRQTAA